MGLLIDTQALVWIASAPEKLGSGVPAALEDPDEALFVSVVTAFEYSDLNMRNRFGADLPLQPILSRLDAIVLPLPAETWRIVEALPRIHRDPVDRMLIAHGIHADLTLVTADATIRSYPVRSIW